MLCKGAVMALDDLLATLERQNGTSGTSDVPADVPPKPAPTLDGTSGTCGTSEKSERKAHTAPFPVWLIHHPDRRPFEVHFSPPATLAEVLATYPAATNAQPVRQQQSARSCRTCIHARRPGGLTTLCGGRDDLPHAYTAGHPLRRLPHDGGASCCAWECEL